MGLAYSAFGVIVFLFFCFVYLREKKAKAESDFQRECALQRMTNISSELKKELERKEAWIIEEQQRFEKTIKQKDFLYEQVKKENSESLRYISSLIADHLTLQYDISSDYLRRKRHPAYQEALRIKDLKKQTKEVIQRSKELQYKYDYLFQLFPDLELYVDSIETINEISDMSNLDELEDRIDKTRYYLSKEEYEQLPENQRNQLALDRYVTQNKKTKWQIGRDYELFVGYEYAKDGWDVEYFGIDRQLNDMGRDLIARKGDLVHIVQCKYWSQSKLIHEKHIAQLYGTTIQFYLSSPFHREDNVRPVFITNITLSGTAKAFANYLKVEVLENHDMEEFPRIKCNINRDESGLETKIYHLPMDQQYDRTKICKPGEFFAVTVEEAVEAGFRRAWRWFGEK